MTKKVRVEDADTSGFRLIVQLWDKGQNGEPDTMSSETTLSGATDLREFHVHASSYLVVKER